MDGNRTLQPTLTCRRNPAQPSPSQPPNHRNVTPTTLPVRQRWAVGQPLHHHHALQHAQQRAGRPQLHTLAQRPMGQALGQRGRGLGQALRRGGGRGLGGRKTDGVCSRGKGWQGVVTRRRVRRAPCGLPARGRAQPHCHAVMLYASRPPGFTSFKEPLPVPMQSLVQSPNPLGFRPTQAPHQDVQLVVPQPSQGHIIRNAPTSFTPATHQVVHGVVPQQVIISLSLTEPTQFHLRTCPRRARPPTRSCSALCRPPPPPPPPSSSSSSSTAAYALSTSARRPSWSNTCGEEGHKLLSDSREEGAPRIAGHAILALRRPTVSICHFPTRRLPPSPPPEPASPVLLPAPRSSSLTPPRTPQHCCPQVPLQSAGHTTSLLPSHVQGHRTHSGEPQV